MEAPQRDSEKHLQIRRHYEWRITPDRQNHEILDWASPFSQMTRFAVLADNVPLAGKSLLDIGCGLGDLLGFLNSRDIPVDYTGVDVSPRMVEEAAKRHGGKFMHMDVFADDCPLEAGSFDVVYSSGAFNLNLGNNLEFMPRALERMLHLARGSMAINLLHCRCCTDDPVYFHHDPANILRMLDKLPCNVLLLDDYLPNDFTVICRKQ